MPTTYTHDLFGKKVYQKLPAEMREVIRRHGNLYRIGLHGPDILFYFLMSKNPVTQYGVNMHKTPAASFFERGMKRVRDTGDDGLLSYLLGFGCHYLLDSACHPFVNQMAEDGVISHTLLEKEFDRKLMQDTGKDPFVYRPSDAVVPKMSYARVIHRAIPKIHTVNIFLSLHMMKFLTNLMICSDGGKKHRLLAKVFSVPGKESIRELSDHFMTEKPAAGSEIPIRSLERLFKETLELAPENLQELYRLVWEDVPLGERWDLTYNG